MARVRGDRFERPFRRIYLFALVHALMWRLAAEC